MQEPKQSHLLAAKRILRYVQRTVDFGILFPKGESGVKLELVGYSASDWCGDKCDRKNTTNYIFFFGRTPISWSSIKEPIVALSSCEAENIAASKTACQEIWLDALMKEFQVKSKRNVKLLVDNQSGIDLEKTSNISWKEQTYRNMVSFFKRPSQQ